MANSRQEGQETHGAGKGGQIGLTGGFQVLHMLSMASDARAASNSLQEMVKPVPPERELVDRA